MAKLLMAHSVSQIFNPARFQSIGCLLINRGFFFSSLFLCPRQSPFLPFLSFGFGSFSESQVRLTSATGVPRQWNNGMKRRRKKKFPLILYQRSFKVGDSTSKLLSLSLPSCCQPCSDGAQSSPERPAPSHPSRGSSGITFPRMGLELVWPDIFWLDEIPPLCLLLTIYLSFPLVELLLGQRPRLGLTDLKTRCMAGAQHWVSDRVWNWLSHFLL